MAWDAFWTISMLFVFCFFLLSFRLVLWSIARFNIGGCFLWGGGLFSTHATCKAITRPVQGENFERYDQNLCVLSLSDLISIHSNLSVVSLLKIMSQIVDHFEHLGTIGGDAFAPLAHPVGPIFYWKLVFQMGKGEGQDPLDPCLPLHWPLPA